MSVKKTILLVLVSVFVATCSLHKSGINAKSSAINDSTLGSWYAKGLAGSYVYMYSDKKPQFSLEDRDYGEFLAGFKGILLYTDLKYAITDYLKEQGLIEKEVHPSHDDITPFEILSGHNAFTSGQKKMRGWGIIKDGKQDFHHYNTAIIKWGYENLIPSPESMIGDRTAQEVYDNMFTRFFRTLTASYIYLNNNNYDAEVTAYQANFDNVEFQAKHYLEQRFGGKLQQFENHEILPVMKPSMAFGFWMRRKIDGSHSEFWTGLSKVMMTFDKTWFEENTKLMKK